MNRLSVWAGTATRAWRSLCTQSTASGTTTAAATADAQRTVLGTFGEHRPCGVLARKIGMTSLWDADGVHHPITILCVDRCHVTDVIEPNPNDARRRWRIKVGAGPRRPFRTKRVVRYHCADAGVEPKQKFADFLVHEMYKLDIGTEIRASHFTPGQLVDINGISIGKGTQGVMKRWGFKGAPATHGTSKAHRKPGSIGMSTKPGRVFKGKKMAGRMGNRPAMVKRLMVYRVDAPRNLIYVRGPVPGNAGNWVKVRDTYMKIKAGGDAHPPLRCVTDGVIEWKRKGLTAALDDAAPPQEAEAQ